MHMHSYIHAIHAAMPFMHSCSNAIHAPMPFMHSCTNAIHANAIHAFKHRSIHSYGTGQNAERKKPSYGSESRPFGQ
jgi:acetylornithine deacetylase/succinyl-diaminopimelate desuccinylase-like protein